MISGGNATIFVSDMDRSVHFYTEVLGLKLIDRYGDDWATVSAGTGLTIGIHPASPNYPSPGTKGSVMLGLEVNEPLDAVVSCLAQRGIAVKGDVVRGDAGNFVHLDDPDRNEFYLWEKVSSVT